MLKKVIKALPRQKVKWRESPFKSLEDRSRLNDGRKALIPKKVYQTFRVNSFGKTHYQQIQEFRKINPDMDFLFFDEKARDLWMDENWGGVKSTRYIPI